MLDVRFVTGMLLACRSVRFLIVASRALGMGMAGEGRDLCFPRKRHMHEAGNAGSGIPTLGKAGDGRWQDDKVEDYYLRTPNLPFL